MQDFNNKVAVVTGGAGGIGKALVKALLDEGAKVVIADVEDGAMEAAVDECSGDGRQVSAFKVDVRKSESLEALADHVYEKYGACHLLFNNAGVAAPSSNIWETTPNDWAWIYSVNVMGIAHGIQAFVPRMIAGGEEGYVVNTTSGDGGISSLPYQSVYASSKAAVCALTECLASQLESEGTKLKASLFYPSGGVLVTGLWNPERNRPEDLKREKPGAPPPDIEAFKEAMKAAGAEMQFQDLDELARFTLQGVRDERFVIMMNLDDAADQLQARSERYRRAELPIVFEEIPQM
jgi:NAD(P)-dependent dehydrogenase (short-subunit alcohol dehydrogenase family)